MILVYLDPFDTKMARLVNITREENSLHDIYVHRRVRVNIWLVL